MEQPMQPNKNGQASHTMWIRFPESKTRVHPKPGIEQLIECRLNYDTIYSEQKWNNNGTLGGKLNRVAGLQATKNAMISLVTLSILLSVRFLILTG